MSVYAVGDNQGCNAAVRHLLDLRSFRSQQATIGDARPRPKGAPCTKGSFSCEWPRLSDGLNDIKKLFSPTPSKPAKKG